MIELLIIREFDIEMYQNKPHHTFLQQPAWMNQSDRQESIFNRIIFI